MTREIYIPWLDVGLKYSVLIFSVYYLFIRCLGEYHCASEEATAEECSQRRPESSGYYAASLILSLALGFSLIWIRSLITPMHQPLMLLFIIITNCYLHSNGQKELKISEIVSLSLLCFGLCDAIFMMVGMIGAIPLSIVYEKLLPAGRNSYTDFLKNYPVHIIAYFIMLYAILMLTRTAANIKRIRRGLMRIVRLHSGGMGIIIAISLLAICTAFASGAVVGAQGVVNSILLIFVMIMCVMLIFWLRSEIKAEYLMKLREKNIGIIEERHRVKDREILLLLEDNDRLTETIMLDSELIPLLIDAMNGSTDAAAVDETAAKLEEIYASRSASVSLTKSGRSGTKSTGVLSVDYVLNYMAARSDACGVDFAASVETDPEGMISELPERGEFDVILADLTENAIISAREKENGAVAVNFRKSGGSYCLEVLDTGEYFNTDVLRHFGEKQITTHSGEGGSGIGLLTLSGFLARSGASFEIEEFPGEGGGTSAARYSKAVRVIFDGMGGMRIITARPDELKRELKGSRFEVR